MVSSRPDRLWREHLTTSGRKALPPKGGPGSFRKLLVLGRAGERSCHRAFGGYPVPVVLAGQLGKDLDEDCVGDGES